MAPKPLLHLADSRTHSINPAIAGFFIASIPRLRAHLKDHCPLRYQAVAVIAEVIHRATGLEALQLLPAGRAEGPDLETDLALAAGGLAAATVQLALTGRAVKVAHGWLLVK
jgi:hypothetical protein